MARPSSRPVRALCVHGERPCVRADCRYHLWIDWRRHNVLIRDIPETCALDVADDGPHTLAELGVIMGLTRERIRQIEAKALEVFEVRLRRLIADSENTEGTS